MDFDNFQLRPAGPRRREAFTFTATVTWGDGSRTVGLVSIDTGALSGQMIAALGNRNNRSVGGALTVRIQEDAS